MTAESTLPRPVCSLCGEVGQEDDRFCVKCGEYLTGDPEPLQPTARPGDLTTRYLCAGVHLDAAFADEAIAEYLVEPVRALPPSPGVDAVAVLRDAVAARTRRRIRDVLLILLLALLAYVDPAALLVWIVVALAVRAALAESGSRRTPLVWLGIVLVVGIAYLVVPRLVGVVVPALAPLGSGGRGAAIIVAAAVLVLFADELAVAVLLHRWFSSATFVPDARDAPTGLQRFVRTMGHRHHRAGLARVAANGRATARRDDLADVVVYRGGWPFVGSGRPVQPRLIALPLVPVDATTTAESRIDVLLLHEHVAQAVDALRTPASLVPGERLGHLVAREQIVVSAHSLIRHQEEMRNVLRHPEQPPAAYMHVKQARELAARPQEWARYYRRYEVETWDRDLAVSTYLYIGAHPEMLYLEWTHCLLMPIRSEFDRIGEVEDESEPLRRAVMAAVQLPSSARARLASALHTFVPIEQAPGTVVPARYGAARSLREMAADDDVQTYFQQVDALRLVRVLDATVYRAVGAFLEREGYEVTEFQKMAQSTAGGMLIMNNSSVVGSSIAFGGSSATQSGTTTVAQPPKEPS